MVRDTKDKKFDIITLEGAIDTTKDDISKFGLYVWIYEEESVIESKQVL